MAPTSPRRESPVPTTEAISRTLDDDISRSDAEDGSERPVRERLRDASIGGTRAVQKKRSFEDVEEDADESDEQEKQGTRHVRKRSKEALEAADITIAQENGKVSTPEPVDEEMASGVASPKNKRPRDYVQSASTEEAPVDAAASAEEPKTKRAKDESTPANADDQAPATIPPTSGFANASATSPFGALAAKSPQPSTAPPTAQTSNDKFKASGFGTFAAVSASPFGAAANKAGSPFAAPGGAASPWAAKPATPATQPSAFAAAGGAGASLGFGNTSSTSAFDNLSKSSTGSGFGGASSPSAFGSLGGSKLGTFAGGSGPKIEGLSSKPVKAFGAADDTEPEDEGDTEAEDDLESGTKSPFADADGRKDKRFHEQIVETGEEGETTLFQHRAKIYLFDKTDKKWVERGAGNLKLNVSDVPADAPNKTNDNGDSDQVNLEATKEGQVDFGSAKKITARLLLRADGSQRVVLNSPIIKNAKFGDETEPPKGQTILFLGRLAGAKEGDAGLDTLQIKVRTRRDTLSKTGRD